MSKKYLALNDWKASPAIAKAFGSLKGEDIVAKSEHEESEEESEEAEESEEGDSDEVAKSFRYETFIHALDIMKAKGISTAGLIKKRVQITTKDGRTYTAHRWVKEGDEEASPKIAGGSGLNIEQVLAGAGNNDTDRIKALIDNGIYDSGELAILTGASAANVGRIVREVKKKQAAAGQAVSTNPLEPAPGIDNGEESDIKNLDLSQFKGKHLKEVMKQKRSARREELGITYKDVWETYEFNLNGMLEIGFPKSYIAYGTGGLGKTYTLMEKVLPEHNIRVYDRELDPEPEDYDAIVMKGSTGLRDMWANIVKNKDKLIIFDDCDSMWGNEAAENLLKGMLDTTGDGTVRYAATVVKDEEGNPLPREIKFTGQVIFISNLERERFPQPLISSRCASTDLTMTKEETLEKLNDIKDLIKVRAAQNRGGAEIEIDSDSRNATIQWFRDNADDLDIDRINGRTFGLVAQIYQRLKDTGNLDKFEARAAQNLYLV